MKRWRSACRVLLLAAVLAFPAFADTRVTLSRDAVALGETVLLTIDSDQAVASPDLTPLRRDFEIGGIDNARRVEIVNGQVHITRQFRVQLRPRRVGMLTLPALALGNQRTSPMLLEVTVNPGTAPTAPGRASSATTQANSPVFIDTVLDDDTPYVQQAVGVTLRLHYAVDLFSGEFRQAEPAQGGSLQPIGNDSRSVRVVDGRQYQVLERHYLLLPERSGALQLPGATFQGEGAGGFFDDMFGDGREPLSVQAPARTLQVKPIPAGAGTPWLPAHNVTLRIAQPPTQARAGEAFDVVVEMQAEGAMAAQLPAIELKAGSAQVFAEAALPTDTFADGRVQSVVTRRFSIVPQQPGRLSLQVQPVAWWDVTTDAPRRAALAAIPVQVAPGSGRYAKGADPAPDASEAAQSSDDTRRAAWIARVVAWWPWLIAALLLAASAWTLWRRHRRRQEYGKGEAASSSSSIADAVRHGEVRDDADPRRRTAAEATSNLARDFMHAVQQGDLAASARLLPGLATPAVVTLAEVRESLDDAAQVEATQQLERALWGDGDHAAARRALQRAFAAGPRWRKAVERGRELLPPLYPER